MERSEIVINEEYGGFNPVQFGSENCRPEWSYGPNIRGHWLLHYVISGFGTFEREGQSYKVSPGEIFVIPPYTETFYKADKEKPWHYIWIGFTTNLYLPEDFKKPVIKISGAGDVFADMLNCHNMEMGKSAFLSGCIWKLFSLFLESGTKKNDYIEKALSCIHTEYMKDISVSTIAKRLNLERSYFTVLFKERLGVPPGQYLQNIRLEKAAELMTDYGESPTSAATACGYSDIYHFSKAFKKKFGVSPRNYIKFEHYRE
ncbi:MAG: AraC family transcriptional regulator [Clostridia bacterium]|nr:AraC family transcriptional regulator [Clostridia bacterium]